MKIKDNVTLTKKFFSQELKKLATKEELKKLATKEELKKLATKEELKQLEKKITGLDKSILSYKGEIDFKIDDYFQKTETVIKQSESRILGVVSEAMGELKSIQDEHEIFTGRTYENIEKLEDHEIRIKNLEQTVLAS